MRTFIVKTKTTLKIYQETTIQSILTDVVSSLVILIVIGLDILFSKYIGRSTFLDITVCFILLIFLFGFMMKKEKILTKEELHNLIDEMYETK